jgi:hypothetical protein
VASRPWLSVGLGWFSTYKEVLRLIGKGNKPALIRLVPRTARTIDLAAGDRHDGTILLRHDGQRLDRRTARGASRGAARRPSDNDRRSECAGPARLSPVSSSPGFRKNSENAIVLGF